MVDIVLGIFKLLTKWKPDWLYETMPYIYSVTGLGTIFHFGAPVGYGSGALFLTAAFLIWKMRTENRSFEQTIT